MGLRTRRVAARAGSNLGHFPDQFEPNSTTLYIIRSAPPTAPARGRAHSYPRLAHSHRSAYTRLPRPEISPHWKFSACSAGLRGGGRSQLAELVRIKSTFYRLDDASWRHCLLLPVKCGHWIFDGLLWRNRARIYNFWKIFHSTYWVRLLEYSSLILIILSCLSDTNNKKISVLFE